MNRQIPIPPPHPTPNARGMGPDMEHLVAHLGRMGGHPQQQHQQHQQQQQQQQHQQHGPPPEAHFAAGQGGRAPPFYHHGPVPAPSEPTYEQYKITKAEMDQGPPRWSLAQRLPTRLSQNELEKQVDKAKRKGLSGERCLKLPGLTGNRHTQVIKLVDDRNILDMDRNFEWVVKVVEFEKREVGKDTDVITAIRVILKRQRHTPGTPRRAVRQPHQPFRWMDLVQLPSHNPQPRGFEAHPQPQRMHEQVYRPAHNAEAMPHVRPQANHVHQQQPPAPMPPQAATIHQRNPQERLFAEHSAAHHSREPKKPANGPQKPKADKANGKNQKLPKIIQFPRDGSLSDSTESSDNDGDFSDRSEDSTVESLFSDDTHRSTKAKKTPSPSPRRKRTSSPHHRGRRGGSERGSPEHVREHKRPIPKDTSPVRPGSRYAHEDAEIHPSRGPGVHRRESVHGGRPPYRQQRPSFSHKHSSSYDRYHSFGLNEERPSLGFNIREPIGEAKHATHDIDEQREIEHRVRERELAEREKVIKEKELEQKVEQAYKRKQQEKDFGRAHSRGNNFPRW